MNWKDILKDEEDDWKSKGGTKEFTEENIGEGEEFLVSLSEWEEPAEVDNNDRKIARKIFEEIKAVWDDNEPVAPFYNNTIYLVKMPPMLEGGLACTDGNLPKFINDILEDNNVEISGRGKFEFLSYGLRYTGRD
tara:strand:- start:4 stop:408 length:405 start_codon:yes stop_codon:yes gene_type:complete